MPQDTTQARVATFYFSTNDGPNRQPLALPDGGWCYVRVTVSDEDMLTALYKAAPEDDEHVMNTHELSAR